MPLSSSQGHQRRIFLGCAPHRALLWCWGLFVILGFFVILPARAQAAPLTYQYEEQTFQLEPRDFKEWRTKRTRYFYHGIEISLPEERRATPPEGLVARAFWVWDPEAIAKTLERKIANVLNREAGSVRIGRDGEGHILFEGRGLPGRKLRTQVATDLTIAALAEDIRLIQLPVEESEPVVLVTDPELQTLGVREVVTVGESNFEGSPENRRQNIAIGLTKFNGHLIDRGSEFSFDGVLGPVGPEEGYRRELTILGERTLPDYGGGLCQVSTTAFRGAWKAGLPMIARRNHSFAVRYYAPPGTDATIYPPWTDLKFQNDTDGALLLQTFTEGDRAFFIYYGTKPQDRTVELIGPFVWDIRDPPEDRIGETTEISPGERRIVGKAVPGLKALWYRYQTFVDGTVEKESFFSQYEARPNFEEVGVEDDSASATAQDLKGNER